MRYLISLLISNLLIFQPAFATLNNVDKTQIFSKNLLTNGGFESGKAQWTPNDTADFTTSTTTPLEGGVNAEWDADADTDTLITTAVAIPSGWYGRNGVASCLFVTPSGTATHEIQAYDGSNVLSEATITSSTSPTRTITNFIFPSSGSVSLRIYANADEPNLEIDSCFLGPAEGYNVSSVSQATFVGGMESAGAASCEYSESTSSGVSTFVDLGTGTSCAAWTVVSNGPGTISAQGTNDHRLVYTNMPPGNYKFELNGLFYNNAAGSCIWRLSDGTTTYQPQTFSLTSIAGGTNTITFNVSVTTSSTRTYKLQAADDHANSCRWYNFANYPASWKVYRFPTSSEQAYTPDLQAMSWSGYHDSTCVWSRTNTAFGDFTADASCALAERTNQNFGTVSASGSVLPAITFTPKKTGRYYVCAIANSIAGGTTSNTWALQLIDGASTVVAQATGYTPANGAYQASMCGVYVVTSISAKTLTIQSKVSSSSIAITGGAVGSSVEWSIFSIDQSLPAPVLTNMVTTPSSGVEYIKRAVINCNAASTVTNQSGSGWVTSGNRSSGQCTLTFSPAWTSAPVCITAQAYDTTSNVVAASLSSVTTTSAVMKCAYQAGTCGDYVANLFCMGPR